jgi:hypothetical protein
MGACNFTTFRRGASLEAAFREARQDALYESGHGGYTGTIAEKSSVVLRRPQPMTRQQAIEFIEVDVLENDKWGPAFALRIADNKNGQPYEGYVFYGFASS